MTDRDAAQILILYVALPRFVIAASHPNKRGKIMRYNRLQNLTGIIPKNVAFCDRNSYNQESGFPEAT